MADERPPTPLPDEELDDIAIEALAASVATPPPPELRTRILDAARAEGRAGAAVRSLPRWRAAAALAAAAAVVFAVLFLQRGAELREAGAAIADLEARQATLVSRLESQDRRIAGLQEALATQAEVLQVLATPRLVTASLAPQPDREGSVRVLLDAAAGAVAIAARLPEIAADQTYELWAIRGEAAPEPAGLFASGPGLFVLPPLPEPSGITAFAVSIEPAGGSATPTGPIVLAGAVEF